MALIFEAKKKWHTRYVALKRGIKTEICNVFSKQSRGKEGEHENIKSVAEQDSLFY